jgi:hypothetical protein
MPELVIRRGQCDKMDVLVSAGTFHFRGSDRGSQMGAAPTRWYRKEGFS